MIGVKMNDNRYAAMNTYTYGESTVSASNICDWASGNVIMRGAEKRSPN